MSKSKDSDTRGSLKRIRQMTAALLAAIDEELGQNKSKEEAQQAGDEGF
jgi:hypothetical protein